MTFDDATTLAAAQASPEGFVAGLGGPVVLDEIQRVPELLLPIKAEVDRNRTPGRFLLTGSANVLQMPRVSDALTGRLEALTLRPLSQGEIDDKREGFVDAAFRGRPPRLDEPPTFQPPSLEERIARGGFPEVAFAIDPRRRARWFDSYIATIVQRDVRDLADIEHLTALPRLLSILAAQPMASLNYTDLGRDAGLPATTLKRYMTLLEAVYLVHRIPAWSTNIRKRWVKTARVAFVDTGLAAFLQGAEASRLERARTQLGPLLENFVAIELLKQLGWSRTRARLYHLREHGGLEVDLLLEDAAGRVVAIEVKAATAVAGRHVKHLRTLAETLGERFHRGIVLYTGHDVVPFDKRIHAVPVEALWRWGTSPGASAGTKT